VSGETGDRSRIFQFLPQCGKHAVSGETTRSTLENRDQIKHSTGISNGLQLQCHCRFSETAEVPEPCPFSDSPGVTLQLVSRCARQTPIHPLLNELSHLG